MKVLRKVCPGCAYVMFFSVEVLGRPDTDVEFGRECPCCGRPQDAKFTATELDIEEVSPDPDIEAITKSVRQSVGRTVTDGF